MSEREVIVADDRLTRPCPNRKKLDRLGRPLPHILRVLPEHFGEFESSNTRICRVYCTCGLIGPLAPSQEICVFDWNKWICDHE